MPRYFFHTFHGTPLRDEVGVVLPDTATAWEQATQTTGQILRDLDGALKPNKEWRMEVTDEKGKRLFALSMATAIYEDWRPAN